MSWRDEAISELGHHPCCGYHAGQSAAAEPTALAALALVTHGRRDEALPAAAWLADVQAADGSVGVRQDSPTPGWPTSLAVLAWLATDAARFRESVERAIQWTLSQAGKTQTDASLLGHDTSLQGWPWADGTHSWVEPTALHVLALKAAGQRKHARTREAVRLLLDRQLRGGGCNYGNTTVLGQELRPHVQPSGIALLALAGEGDSTANLSGGRTVGEVIRRSLVYLRGQLDDRTAAASLAWGLLGLAAHGPMAEEAASLADTWLATAYERVRRRDKSPHKLSLLLLAALAERSPFIHLPRLP